MSVPSIHGPKHHAAVYSEKIKPNLKNFINGKPTPLDILYIQALDDSYERTKTTSREHFNESISSGEIKVKGLEGNNPQEKLQKLAIELMTLRQEGKINNSTQIILSCKPGDDNGVLDIGRDGKTETWKIKDVIDAIRGGKSAGQTPTSTDFQGTVHLFGHSHEEFDVDTRKEFGNVLMHASGKFNWSHHHAFMIGHIVKASFNIKEGSPEDITRQIRDAIQPYAGYPVYRISHEKVKIKYPRFRDDDICKNNRDVCAVINHKNPTDMLISSIERDTEATLLKRLNTGGLANRLRKNISHIGEYEKQRLLAALAASKTDQTKKLKILSDLGISFKKTNYHFETGPALSYAVEKNRDHLEPELIIFFLELGINPIPDNFFVDVLCKRIRKNEYFPFINSLETFPWRARALSIDDIEKVFQACMESSDCRAAIASLRATGVKFRNISDDSFKKMLRPFGDDILLWTNRVDQLGRAGLRQVADHLSKKNKFLYQFFSEDDSQRANIKNDVISAINDKENLGDFVAWVIEFHKKNNDSRPLKFLLECGLDPNFEIEPGRTLLVALCSLPRPNADLIKTLIDKGAKAKKNSNGWPRPVDALLFNSNQNRNLNPDDLKKILRLLLKSDPDAFKRRDKNGLTLPHRAVRNLNSSFLEALIDVDPKCLKYTSEPHQMTPLHVVIGDRLKDQDNNKKYDKKRFEKIVDLLLKSNAATDAKSTNIAEDEEAEEITTPQDYIHCLEGYENFDLDERQKELITEAGAMRV